MRCTLAYERTPAEAAGLFASPAFIGQFDRVIAEAYVPQGGFGDSNTGVETIKLLGFLEWSFLLMTGRTIQLVTRGDRFSALQRLKSAKYRFTAHGHGGHAADAEAVVVAGFRWSVRDLLELEDVGGR